MLASDIIVTSTIPLPSSSRIPSLCAAIHTEDSSKYAVAESIPAKVRTSSLSLEQLLEQSTVIRVPSLGSSLV